MTVEIRRGTARFTEREMGRATRHAFSFGSVYDPAHVSFGPMICHDEHLLGSGHGFDTHRHADLEIVTWVVSGALTHTDSTGGTHRLVPGEVGHLHAGDGVEHSEVAAAPQTRFVQVWLRSDDGGEPTYAVREVDPGPMSEALTVAGSTLWVARPAAGESVTLPQADLLHVYVASGALSRNSLAEPLAAGDALLVTAEPRPLTVTAAVDAELLVWGLSAADQTT
ncbi:pirin family protein [Nocardioides sp. CER19]|uniref:pirin family protein n=1 Tax=Nocardioides sp. CER19 TaxID=3038538 RepID=UPI00244AD72D|nr:pirin family protein [Nocardioides sp. CER19]MDH2412707.1 pirin family protein [Nocardioides sp. CER19]